MDATAPCVRGLTRSFGDLSAVDQVCFEVAAGEIVGLASRMIPRMVE